MLSIKPQRVRIKTFLNVDKLLYSLLLLCTFCVTVFVAVYFFYCSFHKLNAQELTAVLNEVKESSDEATFQCIVKRLTSAQEQQHTLLTHSQVYEVHYFCMTSMPANQQHLRNQLKILKSLTH